MSEFTIRFEEHPQYLQYTLSGDHIEQDWVDLLHRLVADSDHTGKSRFFVDATRITVTDSILLRYKIGVLTGRLLGARARIATLSQTEDSEQLWETVASNCGAIVKSGHERAHLLKWLLEVA